MLKVKCITNLNMLYFAGETYEIPRSLFDANPTCFALIPEVPGVNAFELPENKVIKQSDMITKSVDALGELHPENIATPKQNDETAGDTNETPAADLETTGEVITEPEKPKAKKRR